MSERERSLQSNNSIAIPIQCLVSFHPVYRMTWKGRAEKLNEVQFLIPPKMKTFMAPGESKEGNQSLTSKMLGFTETAFRMKGSCGDAALCEICSIFSL